MNLDRRSFLKASALAAGALGLGGLAGCSGGAASASSSASASASVSASAAASEDAGRLASFMLLSDTHCDSDDPLTLERFAEVLRQMDGLSPRPDAIFIVGDVTDNGRQDQYDDMWRLVDASPFERSDFVFACGNHDLWSDEETEEAHEVFRQRFVDNTGVPAFYYDREVAGQHVIVLGSDGEHPHSWFSFQLSQEQLDWLDNLLVQDAQKGVVPLVCCHEPIEETVAGTFEGDWGWGNCFMDKGAALLEVLKKHPGCVYVSGHTHVFPAVEATDPALPIFVNTGSASRSYYSLDRVSPDELVFDGVLMNIYADKFEFAARNFKTASWEGETVVIPCARVKADSSKANLPKAQL